MQTFMPYADFLRSAQALDRRRLGKQRVEVLQLLQAVKGWVNHPARVMWRGHERALAEYGQVVCEVWRGYGYKDTCADKIAATAAQYGPETDRWPHWMGDWDFHTSHQSNLIRKNREHYVPNFGDVPVDLAYIWPTN